VPVRRQRAEAVAWAFHETLLQLLRQLNRAAERRGELEGMELVELERSLDDFWTRRGEEVPLRRALALLVENGLVAKDKEPVYAWDRRRTVGERYNITPLGKAYLLRTIAETERIR
jgi:hypothetical protein